MCSDLFLVGFIISVLVIGKFRVGVWKLKLIRCLVMFLVVMFEVFFSGCMFRMYLCVISLLWLVYRVLKCGVRCLVM